MPNPGMCWRFVIVGTLNWLAPPATRTRLPHTRDLKLHFQ